MAVVGVKVAVKEEEPEAVAEVKLEVVKVEDEVQDEELAEEVVQLKALKVEDLPEERQ